LLLVGDERALHGLCMQAGRAPMTIAPEWRHDPAAFPDVRSQLSEYFAGQRTRFDLALEMDGTPFQRRVWDALQSIPTASSRVASTNPPPGGRWDWPTAATPLRSSCRTTA